MIAYKFEQNMGYLTHQKKKEVLFMKKILLSSVLLSSLFFSTNYSHVSANEIQNNSQESTEIQLPTSLSSIDFNTQESKKISISIRI